MIVLPDVVIGHFAMVAAGSVVTQDVPDYGFVMGVPGRLVGYVCKCGRKLVDSQLKKRAMKVRCEYCQGELLLK